MAIAHDVETVGTAYTTAGTQTVSHAASASARAAVVLIAQNAANSDHVTGVTYGGVAMTRIRYDSEATEAGAVYIYWLDGIAGGTQNVVMTSSGVSNKQMVIATMTVAAGATVTLEGSASGVSASTANPTWQITGLTPGKPLLGYEVIHSGLTTMTNTPLASSGWVLISSTDLGSQGRGFARRNHPTPTTTQTAGWTAATADDFVGASAAFAESAGTAHTSTPADEATATDAAARAAGKSAADTATATDAASRKPVKSAADSATATDASSRKPVKKPADTVTATDASTRTAGKKPADTATAADAATRMAAFLRAPADAATASDSFSKSHARGSAVDDIANVADAPAKKATTPKADSVAASDAFGKAVQQAKADTAGTSDLFGKTVKPWQGDVANSGTPEVVSVAASVANYGVLSGFDFPLPSGRRVGDLIAIHILMNGAAGVPANWTVKSNVDNANALIYAWVDGTIITAGDAPQTVNVTSGGSYQYGYEMALVRGAGPVGGDPFDAIDTSNFTGTTSGGFDLTTTGRNRLLLLVVSNIYSTTPASVTPPLVTVNNFYAPGHVAAAVQASPATTAWTYFTYNGSRSSWGMFLAIKPAGTPDLPVMAVQKPAADTATASDTPSLAAGYVRAAADSATATDSFSKVHVSTRPAADIANVTDATAKSPTPAKADTVTAADVPSVKPGRTVADSVGVTDSPIKAIKPGKADTVTATDAVSRKPVKKPADTVTATDATAKRVTQPRSDTATATDAASRKPVKKPADTVTATDASTRRTVKQLSDTATATDAIVRAAATFRADAVVTSDTIGKVITILFGDDVDPMDVPTLDGTFTMTADQADEVYPSDQLAKILGKPVADGVTATDAVVRVLTRLRTIADTATATDARTSTIGKGRADTATATDALSRRTVKAEADVADTFEIPSFRPKPAKADAVTASDAVDIRRIVKAVADTVTVADVATPTLTRTSQPASDVVIAQDAVIFLRGLIYAYADSVAPVDAVSIRMTLSLHDALGGEAGTERARRLIVVMSD